MTMASPDAPRPIHDRLPQTDIIRKIGVTAANLLGKFGELVVDFIYPGPNNQQQEMHHDR